MNKFLLLMMLIFSQALMASVSEVDYLNITSALHSIYGKKVEATNNNLKFTLKDSKQAPNAYAAKTIEGNWEITDVASLLSLQEQTKATLGIILCHEIGHFFGGEPYVVGIQMTPAVRSRAPKKMSCEGQADYFATGECIKELANKLPDLFDGNQGLINPLVDHYCDESYFGKREKVICRESLVASYQAVRVYQRIMEELLVPSSFFGKVENEKSDRTLNYVGEYPDLDCRYETFIKGALCSSLNESVCSDMKWKRPACWFQEEL